MNNSSLLDKKLILTLALKELRHDWRSTTVLLCIIFSIVAPLLILFGLKQGVITTQQELLLNDPCNLEIKMQGSPVLLPSWVERMEKNPHVRFVLPLNRYLSMDIDIIDQTGKGHLIDLIPTRENDPLLTQTGIQAPIQNNQVLITHALAKSLHLKKGDELRTELFLTESHQTLAPYFSLIVKDILPNYSCLQHPAILTTPALLYAVEDFKEKSNVELFLVEVEKNKQDQTILFPDTAAGIAFESRKSYVKARVFANSLDEVLILADQMLASQPDIKVTTKAAEITKLKLLNQFLNYIFGIVSVIVIGGGILVLAGCYLMTIKHKRLQIAQLRLLGMEKKQVGLFFFAQGWSIATIAFLIAFLLSVMIKIATDSFGKETLSYLIQASNNEILFFYLAWFDYLLAYVFTLVLSGAVIVIGTKQTNAIEAGEQLREL